MSRSMRFTDPGEGIHEAEIVEVLVAAGDRVQEGDSVLAVETDKATTELPATYSGEIEQVAVAVGDHVEVGDLLLSFAGDGDSDDSDDAGDAEPKRTESAPAAKPDSEQPDSEQAHSEQAHAGQGQSEQPETEQPDSGQARSEQAQSEQPSSEQARSEQGQSEQPGSEQSRSDQARSQRHKGPVPAAPSTRRLARELGIALDQVTATGPGGRVLDADVRSAAESPTEAARAEQAEPHRREPSSDEPRAEQAESHRRKPSSDEARAAKQSPTAAAEPLPDFSRWGEVEQIELRSVRRATARETARAWAEIPHVMHHDRADVTDLEHFRRAHLDEIAAAGGKLTLTVLVLKAAAAALRAMPRFNASLDADGKTILLKRYCHIGVAVATEQGLLVPVVRDVDRKPVRELAVELVEQARRARAGELSRDEMQGGSFTVTNVGGIGGRLFTPIIRSPEAAILGLARAELTPVATGDIDAPVISARLQLPLCLAFDHRLNDGADAAQFVNRIIDSLQDPESLLLSV